MAHSGRLFRPGNLFGIALAISCGHVHALGLGNLVLHSHLGMPLSASVELNGIDTENQPNLCLRSRLESLDGRLLTMPQSTLARKGNAGEVRIRSRESVEEPAATLSIEIGCGATVRREFAILLDPAPAQAAMPAALAPALSSAQESTNAASGRGKSRLAEARTSPKRLASPGMKEKEGAASVLHISVPAPLEPQAVIAAESTRLKMTESLSEAQLAADPARREAMRADQRRVAALLRGEDPYQAMESRLREAQVREKAMRQEATLSKQQSVADHQALDGAKRHRWIDALLAGLASALLALGGRVAWLRWRGARERQAQEPFSLESVDTDLHDSPPAKSLRMEAVSPQVLETGEATRSKADIENPNLPIPVFSTVTDPADDLLVTPSSEEASREKTAPPLDFGFVWHESKETVMNPAPFAPAAAAADNERGWPIDAAIDTPPVTLRPTESAAEIATLLLGVEIWMTDHNPVRAIGMLEPACAQEPQLSPAPMRYLIELYRIVGDEEKLAAMQMRFASRFPLADASEHAGWQYDAAFGLADLPEVLAEIEHLDDGDDLLGYLRSLLMREEGFDFPTYRDIVQHIAAAMELQQQRDMADMSLDFQHD